MKNYSRTIIVLFILLNFTGIAQTDKNFQSTTAPDIGGLHFLKESDHKLDDSTYTDIIQLTKLTGKVQALQFRILFNKSDDDTAILTFKDVQKGSDLKDPSWLLDYNVIKGSNTADDEIYVVLYNSNLQGGLPPGDHNDLVRVVYEIIDVVASAKEIKSSIKISHAQASTFNGFPINIEPTLDEFKVYVKSK
ncbi:MAG: hypothetical protein IPM14_14790 [bacterium]|nr:hypothetical protein [bacterium]